MATQEKSNTNPQKSGENNTLKTIGALGGIVVLLALLFIGVSQSKPAGAEMITDGAKPEQTEYQNNASELDYEKAVLKEYENGKLIEMNGKIHRIFEEPVKGDASILVTVQQASQGGSASTVETNQVMLTFLEGPSNIEEHEDAHIFGRYIGTLEYETAIGTMKEVPAIQVDYMSIGS